MTVKRQLDELQNETLTPDGVLITAGEAAMIIGRSTSVITTWAHRGWLPWVWTSPHNASHRGHRRFYAGDARTIRAHLDAGGANGEWKLTAS